MDDPTRLFSALIESEVDKTEEADDLLRSDTMLTKMMCFYAQMVGSKYIQDVIGDVVVSICESPEGFEVEVSRLTLSDDENSEADRDADRAKKVAENAQRLRDTAQAIFTAVKDSVDKMPAGIRSVCAILKEKTEQKFEEHGNAAVVSFLFLRYICPAIREQSIVISLHS